MSMSPLIIKDQFGIIRNLQTFSIFETSFLVGTFFAASYSKKVLETSEIFNCSLAKPGSPRKHFLVEAEAVWHLSGK